MRQVLVDYARARASLKRSGGVEGGALRTTRLEVRSEAGMELVELIELDSAIQALAAENESLARLIEMTEQRLPELAAKLNGWCKPAPKPTTAITSAH